MVACGPIREHLDGPIVSSTRCVQSPQQELRIYGAAAFPSATIASGATVIRSRP